ncbi:MAG: ABC transporter permease [Spirochaetales bacterium]|nr:ABC transporter permease [Spirochaetales bacterium]
MNETKTATTDEIPAEPGFWRESWYQLTRNRAAMVGLVIIALFAILAIFAPLLAPADPVVQSISERMTPPLSPGYLLGTDDLGRDMLSRIIYGGRISLVIGVVSVGISLVLGGILGLAAGYFGGWTDRIIMRIIDIMLAFPYILLTIVIVAMLGPSLFNAMVAIGISQMPRYARVIRASVISEREQDYVLAERSLGTSDLELMFRTILPNALAPTIVQATLGVGEAILSSAGLSFLGLGAQPPTPEWGLMIASSKQFITTAWWIVTLPGIAILLTVLGFNLLGDGLRDILDPRMRD